MKEYASWPTFPQLYVKGEFVGGCDIVKEMFASGELYEVLGKDAARGEAAQRHHQRRPPRAPSRAASEGEQGALRSRSPRSSSTRCPSTSRRRGRPRGRRRRPHAAVRSPERRACRRPAASTSCEPATAASRSTTRTSRPRCSRSACSELEGHARRGRHRAVRRAHRRRAQHGQDRRARSTSTRPRKRSSAKLDKDTPLYFHCHHGGRSQQAAEHYLRQGFKQVYNVAGGIDAWSARGRPRGARATEGARQLRARLSAGRVGSSGCCAARARCA